MQPPTARNINKPLTGFGFAIFAALMFSCKAIVGKLVYAVQPIPVSQLLAMRMLYALPLFMGLLIYSLRTTVTGEQRRIQKQGILPIAAIGVIGYYISSYLDFLGLKFISAGLERIIIYTYPTMVLLLGFLFQRKRIYRYQLIAVALCYAGVLLAFVSDLQSNDHSGKLMAGVFCIIGCAFTYALYVILSPKFIKQAGIYFFTSVAILGATAAVLVHYFIEGHSLGDIALLPARIHLLMAIMAVFTTFVPILMTTAAIQWIGSQNLAITSSIGPVFTIILAWYLLGEHVGWLEYLGTGFVIAGVYLVGKKVNEAPATT